MGVEPERFVEEGRQLAAETRKLNREAVIAVFTAFTAGTAPVGAIAAC